MNVSIKILLNTIAGFSVYLLCLFTYLSIYLFVYLGLTVYFVCLVVALL